MVFFIAFIAAFAAMTCRLSERSFLLLSEFIFYFLKIHAIIVSLCNNKQEERL